MVNYTKTKAAFNILKIVSANYLSDFTIRVKFNDGIEKNLDFKPFLLKSLNPTIKKYLEKTNFENFEIIDGNLNWNDYEMIFPISDLYSGKI